ncbi:MAG: SPOR domain-containing protein [Candidatus Latescibacteria bacterium]|nr:SPOR domain-containing protein [Candidatus Latescibacterota bacterium]
MVYLIRLLFVRLAGTLFCFVMITFGLLYVVYTAGYRGVYDGGWIIAAACGAYVLVSAGANRVGQRRVQTLQAVARQALQAGQMEQAQHAMRLALRWLDAGWVVPSTRGWLRHDLIVASSAAGFSPDERPQTTPGSVPTRPSRRFPTVTPVHLVSRLSAALSGMRPALARTAPSFWPGHLPRRWRRRMRWMVGGTALIVGAALTSVWLVQSREEPNLLPLQTAHVAAYVSSNPFTIQAGAYRTQHEAEEVVRAIRQQGEPAYWRKTTTKNQGVFFQVRVGDFSTKRAAMKYCRTRIQREVLPREAFVTFFEGGFVTLDPVLPQSARNGAPR